MAAPALDDDLGLGEAVEDLPVEQFVPEFRVEALTVEPLRVCRRLILVSYAAIGSVSRAA